jgi:hypothetical protein
MQREAFRAEATRDYPTPASWRESTQSKDATMAKPQERKPQERKQNERDRNERQRTDGNSREQDQRGASQSVQGRDADDALDEGKRGNASPNERGQLDEGKRIKRDRQ